MKSALSEIQVRGKLSRDAKYLLKSYTKEIPMLEQEFAKLKRELESLRTKENKEQKEKQPDLTPENKNLRLKKGILEMEVKRKETNRER